MQNRKIIFAVVLCASFASMRPSASAVEPSTGTVTVPEVASSTQSITNVRQVNAAIETLNYKIELIQGRYIQLGRDIEDVRAAERDQNKALVEQRLSLLDSRRLRSIDAELQMMRSDIAQLKEDVSLLNPGRPRTGVEVAAAEPAGSEAAQWIRKNWLGASALFISLITLVAH
jgi:hypothetical protein